MSVFSLIVVGWFVVVIFWMLNHFHRKNVKFEAEYRQRKYLESLKAQEAPEQ